MLTTVNRGGQNEIPYIHVLRVLACFLVCLGHSIPNELIQFDGTLADNRYLLGVSYLVRCNVPLFFMITGALILPIKQKTLKEFYVKRIPRVFWPLMFWGVVYAIFPYLLGLYDWKAALKALILVPIESPQLIGGILWYLFVLIGIYLILPFISSEVFSNRKMMIWFLLLWCLAAVVFDMKGEHSLLLGNREENDYGMLYSFTGFLGYLFLGNFLATMKGNIPWVIILGLFIVSVAYRRLMGTNNFLSLSSIMLAASVWLAVRQLNSLFHGCGYERLKVLSKLSFGIYLSHMIGYWLVVFPIYQQQVNVWIMIGMSFLTFFGGIIITYLISLIPQHKYIIG